MHKKHHSEHVGARMKGHLASHSKGAIDGMHGPTYPGMDSVTAKKLGNKAPVHHKVAPHSLSGCMK